MRLVRLGFLIALAGCQAGTFSPGVSGSSSGGAVGLNAPSGGRADHLYVAAATASNPNYSSVQRFRLVNGIPRSKPDRVYSGGQGMLELIAVSSDGTLYAAGIYSQSLTVYAFDGGNTKPDRTIQMVWPPHCGAFSSRFTTISALAADPQGDLFVGILTYDQANASHRGRSTAPPKATAHVPCNGVAIFARDAKGQAKPIQSIDLGYAGYVNSLAVDAANNLYIGDYPGAILQYANAVKKPTPTRTFGASVGWVSSLATDAAGDIFVSSTNYQNALIDRYASDVKSFGPASSEIQLAGSGFHSLQYIAVRGRDLYADDKLDSVDLYHARKNGPQIPFYSLAASKYFEGVAVGP